MYRRCRLALVLTFIAVCTLAALAEQPTPAPPPAAKTQNAEATNLPADHAERLAKGVKLFKSDVREILIKRCLACHGGDTVESEFNLATRKGFLQGGRTGPAVADAGKPGKAKQSVLYEMLAHKAEPHMPYEEDKLPDAQIAKIVDWIDLGAPYDKPLVEGGGIAADWRERTVPEKARQWWAFQPLSDSEPPTVVDEAWCRTPIDRFILAKLEAEGMTPNKAASRRTLVRRAAFDLVGLPPAPEAVEAFVNDSSPDAWTTLIDRLLDSEHYGERWARHWLDVARFAESHGFEQDYNREYAYHYRDFVIKALNVDMAYDRFVKWQLAGDEYAPDDPLAMTATGFLGAGVFPTQITANEVEPSRYDALDDMAATTGTAFLGLTVGCARCHDHKFDPIPQTDYYRFVSTFTTTVRSNIDLTLNPDEYAKQKSAFDAAHAPLAERLAQFEARQLPERLQHWEEKRTGQPVEQWIILDAVEAKSTGGATLTRQDDGSFLASGTNPDSDTYTFTANTDLRGVTAIRLEALSDPALPKGGPGRAANGNMGVGDFKVTAAPVNGNAKPVAVKLIDPKAGFQQNDGNLSIAASIDDDPKTGWAVDPQFGKNHAAAFHTAEDVGLEGGTKLTITLTFQVNKQHNIGRPRLSITTASRPVGLEGASIPQSVLAILRTASEKRTNAQNAALLAWYRHRDSDWRKLHAEVVEHLAKAPKPETVKAMVTSEGFTPIRHHTQGADFFEQTFFLNRGDTDQKNGVAPQSFLQVLTRHPDGAKHWQVEPPDGSRTSYRRRSLANWITDVEDGPGRLLARVIVNRLWQHHFGEGLVSTPNDFGAQGKPPSHPELLDWLARELIDGGWKLKRIHRLIIQSAVYRQSADFDEADAKRDPQNRLHWRRNPERLEAEVIRDAMLAVSGMLDHRMFGPGTLDEGHKRRSIYFMVKRSKLIPMMQIFDAPEPLVSVGERPSTTVAPQALLFMNSPHVRGYAEGFANRLKDVESIREVVPRAYEIALAREPTEAELADNASFLVAQIASYQQAGKQNPRELALADFCQVLMSLNEFVYVE